MNIFPLTSFLLFIVMVLHNDYYEIIFIVGELGI